MPRSLIDRQRIAHIASAIYEGNFSREEAAEQNDGEGWTYETRWRNRTYGSDAAFTLVENDSLDPDALEVAFRLVDEWRAGRFGFDDDLPSADW